MLKIKNNTVTNISDIPIVSITELRNEVVSLNKRPVGFFGQKTDGGETRLFVVLADDREGDIYVSSAKFSSDEKIYESFTKEIPAFHIFEREFYEQFGIKPEGHPWLKPVRLNQDEYEFFDMKGEEVHQVAVGPIHAGVIEPGHFRFMCNGETVYHLEIMLGYQHRGIEDLILKTPSNQLAESICGDSVIAYNTAFSQVMENLQSINISEKSQLIRKAALEMERMAIHIGDLGAIAGDIAYLMGASVFGATRTLVINSMLEFCGSRFGRGLICTGGVNYDFTEDKIERALKTFDKVIKDVERMVNTMLKSSTVMSRLEKTGTISMERAQEAGLVGMAARAAGVDLDSRFDFPDKWVSELQFEKKKFKATGDVNARFKLRYKEILQSYSMIKKIFMKLKDYSGQELAVKSSNSLTPNAFTISIVEGWRGEIIHIALTDDNGNLARYKIKDPSFNNWYGLALAVRNNGVSDFPLCNKSFNLSYAGNDL